MSERARCAGSRWAPPAASTSIVLYPPGPTPASPTTSVRTITEMMAKGTYGIIVLATKDLDGTFERLQAGDAEVVQEPDRAALRHPRLRLSRSRGQHGPHQRAALTAVTAQARDRETRKADTLAMLATPAIDVWVATASAESAPHLVPRVAGLGGGTGRGRGRGLLGHRTNLTASGTARLAVGPTRDVVMLDAVLETAVDVAADDALGTAYAAQADWDPRGAAGYVFLVLRPVRVQAWREANEIAGRTLMRDGTWLV